LENGRVADIHPFSEALPGASSGRAYTASLWILRPFLVAVFWSVTVVIATWPVLLRAQAILGGKRSLAVVVMTTALLALFVIPFYFAVSTVADNI
jgi:predicted PurR-regulated permease PerM